MLKGYGQDLRNASKSTCDLLTETFPSTSNKSSYINLSSAMKTL